MVILPLAIAFLGYVLVPKVVEACAGACTTDANCASNACAYCDTLFSRCADCCEFVDQADCPSACTWNSGAGDCRNSAATACGVTVPETPRTSRYFFYGALLTLLALAVGLGTYRIRRRPKTE